MEVGYTGIMVVGMWRLDTVFVEVGEVWRWGTVLVVVGAMCREQEMRGG